MAQSRAAQAKLVNARGQLERGEKLLGNDWINQADYDQLVLNVATAESEVVAAKVAVENGLILSKGLLLLAVTATDTAVLCGNHGEVSWGKYGAYPLHRPYCHEGAVRILLACIEAHAARHKRHEAGDDDGPGPGASCRRARHFSRLRDSTEPKMGVVP